MKTNTLTSSRQQVKTESDDGATAPHVPVAPVNTKIAEQRQGAVKVCQRRFTLEYDTQKKERVFLVDRWATSNRSVALKSASGLVSGMIDEFRKVDFSDLDAPSRRLVVEACYRLLFEQMHAIKYKPIDSRGKSEFDGAFLEFERGAAAAMEQGDVNGFHGALGRLSSYLTLANSSSGNFDGDGKNELGSVQFVWPLELSAKNNYADFQISPNGRVSKADLETLDELIADLEGKEKAQDLVRRSDAEPMGLDVRSHLGQQNRRLLNGNGTRENDEKSPRSRDGVAHRSGLAKSSAIGKHVELLDQKGLPNNVPKHELTGASCPQNELRQTMIKSRIEIFSAQYEMFRRTAKLFTTTSTNELVKYAASSLSGLQKEENGKLYPNARLSYLSSMSDVFDCWVNLTKKKKDASDLDDKKKVFVERSLALLAEDKISQFHILCRREIMLMMDSFDYRGNSVRVLGGRRGIFPLIA
ncbi:MULTISPECIES: hypothetical protein [unclassified Rhizobacter]|uniref:hypothetical protein n=1 Tax=unclassified Rhizobacter TaxID=2640088 RepID=UPI000B2C6272|nr:MULTISPECIES: hypothetical protein [unclassified Rhizobacter]